MSGLAAVLAGRVPAGVYRWHGAFDVADVRHTVEHAGQAFAHVDGWTHPTKPEFLAAVGEALSFPDYYGQNFDALADLLHDVGADGSGTVLLWDGWGPLAREDTRSFAVAVDVLRKRTESRKRAPFTVLLRGDGPDIDGVPDLD